MLTIAIWSFRDTHQLPLLYYLLLIRLLMKNALLGVYIHILRITLVAFLNSSVYLFCCFRRRMFSWKYIRRCYQNIAGLIYSRSVGQGFSIPSDEFHAQSRAQPDMAIRKSDLIYFINCALLRHRALVHTECRYIWEKLWGCEYNVTCKFLIHVKIIYIHGRNTDRKRT